MRRYFDNAATSYPKPPAVAQAVQHYFAQGHASAGRGAYREALAAARILDECRAEIQGHQRNVSEAAAPGNRPPTCRTARPRCVAAAYNRTAAAGAPTASPTMNDIADLEMWRKAAGEYLRAQLGQRAPHELKLVETFREQPLAGEGPVALFTFDCLDGLGRVADPRHYVVVGQTTPNYFPAYGLGPDDAYSFHIGTRFMLEMGVSVADARFEPADARESLRALLAACNPGVPIEREELAGLFRCQERLFAVYRVTLGGQDVYCMGADCPPGFYELTDYPPQIALRLHLGQLIRAEARHELARVVSARLSAAEPPE